MTSDSFLQDLAIVMIVAGLVTLIFHRVKQPVVLGYLLAGFIIGPYTPPFPLITNLETISILADLGVVFLMFSLGMDFNLRKLRKVGLSAFLVAAFEILMMIFAGYLMGAAFGWNKADCIFLGVMLALTSTMIVVKSLRDRGEIHTRHAGLISGVSLFDDMFVILIMVALPGFARTGSLPTWDLVLIIAGLLVFLVAAVVVGILLVPRLLRYIARHATGETLLIVSLGLCFGLALFALKLGLSAALGAFLIGAVVAESRDVGRIANLTEPLRDMFVAVFFVAIGMQIEPRILGGSLLPAILIGIGYTVVKVLACAIGAFLTGADGKTSMRVGTNMAQLGEFAFILATLGFHYELTSAFLYPLIVTIACLNALVRPYLVDNADRMATWLAGHLPENLVKELSLYRQRVAGLGIHSRASKPGRIVWNLALQIALNMTLIAGGFIAAGLIKRVFPESFAFLPDDFGLVPGLIWLSAAVLLLPLYVATYRKMQAMAMLLSEFMTANLTNHRPQRVVKSVVSGVLFSVQLIFLLVLTLLVSAALLPPWQTLLVLLFIISGLVIRYGRAFNRWYSQGKFAFLSTFQEADVNASAPPLIPAAMHISDAHLKKIALGEGAHAGLLIRELELRTLTGASIVALERPGKTLINPGPDEEILAGDELLLIGNATQLEAAEQFFRNGREE
jgi:monovalent cation:H+ antiporter-2, CPA2 family